MRTEFLSNKNIDFFHLLTTRVKGVPKLFSNISHRKHIKLKEGNRND